MDKELENSGSKVLSVLWEAAGAFVCGLIFSRAQLGPMISPIPVAVAMCLGPIGASSVLLGAILSGLVTGTITNQLMLIVSLMLAACVRVVLREYHSPRFVFIVSGVCVLTSGTAEAFSTGSVGESILIAIMSALLSATTSYFLLTVLTGLINQKKIHLRSSVGCAAAVVYFVLIAALSSFSMSLVNPGYIAGVAVTLIAAQRFRYTGGVICGALTACGAMLSADEYGVGLVFLPVTGLLAGYMSEAGSFAASGVFFLCNALAQLTVGTGDEAYSSLGNLMLGCVFYLFLHTICIDKWIITEQPACDHMLENMAVRMRFMAETISGVRCDTEKISGLLSHSGDDKDADKTVQRVRRAKYAQKRESRRILYEQLIAAEEILSSFGDSKATHSSSQLTEVIERTMESYNYICDSAAAYYNDTERLAIEIYSSDKEILKAVPTICHILSHTLNVQLEALEPVRTKESVCCRFCQPPRFRLRLSEAARNAENSPVSGDTTLLFRSTEGEVYAILSDGMGTGGAAAVESRMTAEMFQRLTTSGISDDSALRIINGLMLTKSENEGFATFDAVRFNLDVGQATLIKSGASSTILRQGDKVTRVCAPTFPIGAGVSPDVFVREMQLSPGDVVIMLSDGVPESLYPFIKELLLSTEETAGIAEEICRKADVFSGGKCLDDVSVAVLQLIERAV